MSFCTLLDIRWDNESTRAIDLSFKMLFKRAIDDFSFGSQCNDVI